MNSTISIDGYVICRNHITHITPIYGCEGGKKFDIVISNGHRLTIYRKSHDDAVTMYNRVAEALLY